MHESYLKRSSRSSRDKEFSHSMTKSKDYLAYKNILVRSHILFGTCMHAQTMK